MKARLGWLLLTSLVVLGAAPVLGADVTPAPSGQQRELERLRRRLDKLRERAALPSAAPSASAATSANPSASTSAAPVTSQTAPASRAELLARKWAELTASRRERRERHRSALLREVGARMSDPNVASELKLHSRRVAELARLEFLAQNARDGEPRQKLLARIAKLSTQEADRHKKRLARLVAPAQEAPR
jgi:hypothetical protein